VISASWEIDIWGRIRRLNEAARAQLLGSEDARRAVILSLVGRVPAPTSTSATSIASWRSPRRPP
jgi:hypothetical protein